MCREALHLSVPVSFAVQRGNRGADLRLEEKTGAVADFIDS